MRINKKFQFNVWIAIFATLSACSKEVSSDNVSPQSSQELSDNGTNVAPYDDTAIKDRLSQLDSKTQELDDKVGKLDIEMNEMNDKLSKLNEAIRSVVGKLGGLDDLIRKLYVCYEQYAKDFKSLQEVVVRLANKVKEHDRILAQLDPSVIAALQARVDALEKKTNMMTYEEKSKKLILSGVNVQIVNGLNRTSSKNSVGNLIVGYNEPSHRLRHLAEKNPAMFQRLRGGSHNVIIGTKHTYSSVGGIVAGYKNGIHGPYSSVTGGYKNHALGGASSISGGKELKVNRRFEWAAGHLQSPAPSATPQADYDESNDELPEVDVDLTSSEDDAAIDEMTRLH